MRVVLYAAGGPLAESVFNALVDTHEIVTIVRPAGPPGFAAAIKRAARRMIGNPVADSIGITAAHRQIPEIRATNVRDRALQRAILAAPADVGVIATFPWLIPPTLLSGAALGTLNVHPSLLPRHRGPSPYFWTYFRDDHEAGVSVHVAEPRADAGAIVEHRAVPLPRAHPVQVLHADLAREAGVAILSALDRVAQGDTPEPQDEREATDAPRVATLTPVVPFADWGAERTWHFLAGLSPYFCEPIHIEGRAARYSTVTGYELRDAALPPGSARMRGQEILLACTDGVVTLARAES